MGYVIRENSHWQGSGVGRVVKRKATKEEADAWVSRHSTCSFCNASRALGNYRVGTCYIVQSEEDYREELDDLPEPEDDYSD